MTTNPETAGVEPVAFCNKCGYYGPVDQYGRHRRPRDGVQCNYTAHPPAAREDGDVVQKCEMYRAAKRLSDNIAEFGTITDGIFVEDLDRAVEAMRGNPFCDDIATLGTTQQDMRMEHYGRVTLAAMPTTAAIRAETTAQIVAWLENWIDQTLGQDVDPKYVIEALQRGDHLTGGEA